MPEDFSGARPFFVIGRADGNVINLRTPAIRFTAGSAFGHFRRPLRGLWRMRGCDPRVSEANPGSGDAHHPEPPKGATEASVTDESPKRSAPEETQQVREKVGETICRSVFKGANILAYKRGRHTPRPCIPFAHLLFFLLRPQAP